MAKHQKVVLLQDVPSLGQRGEVVQVRAGFARNYLLPRGLAVTATPSILKELDQLRKRLEKAQSEAKQTAEQLRSALESEPLIIHRRTGREDLLFEAVTRDTIAEALAERGITVDRRQIRLDQPIKRAGHYEVTVHLYEDVNATLQLNVEPLNE